MDDVGQVGLLAPPENPQLLGLGLDLAAPHAEQVGLNAAHEAAQHWVVLGGGRDHWPVLPTAAEAVATPFNARQLRLGEERKHSSVPSKHRKTYEKTLLVRLYKQICCVTATDFLHMRDIRQDCFNQ